MNRRGEYGHGPRQYTVIGQSYDDIFYKQLTEFQKLRGFDELSGGLEKVPRTTYADVMGLVDYWDKALDGAKKVFGHANVVKRWKQARVLRDPFRDRSTDSAIYPKNADFWRELRRLAVHVAAAKEQPSKWEMAKESVVQSVKDLPSNVYEASTAGPRYIRKKIYEGVKDVAAPLTKGLLLPILIGAGVLVGGVVLVKATSKSRD